MSDKTDLNLQNLESVIGGALGGNLGNGLGDILGSLDDRLVTLLKDANTAEAIQQFLANNNLAVSLDQAKDILASLGKPDTPRKIG